MSNPAAGPQSKRHCLSDWLSLHELDQATCRDLLDLAEHDLPSPPAPASADTGAQRFEVEQAWKRTLEAFQAFFPARREIVDDTFANTTRILVDRPDGSRKALTLDVAPYPAIHYSFHGRAADCLIIAHEFGHALQIRASRRSFTPPIVREICAFLGEHALLSHARQQGPPEHAMLLQPFDEDSRKYYGKATRLRKALPRLDAPYDYSWNYPIARVLAARIMESCSPEWIWTVFKGETSVPDILQELRLEPK